MIDINMIRNLVRLLGKNVEELGKNEMLCCGVSVIQCNAVLEIGLANESSLGELATKLSIDKSTMSRIIDLLVDRGIVERRTNINNRRYVNICLTKAGKEFFDKIRSILEMYFIRIFDSIPEDKREQVKESIELLIAAMEKNPCCDLKGDC